jgi:hypothetical protein
VVRKATACVVVVLVAAGAVQFAQAAHPAGAHWRILTLAVPAKSFSYAEPNIVSGPDHRTLIIDAASANTGAPPTFWISRDGGQHWSVGRDLDATRTATGDADALIGPDGRMYALNLGYNPNPHQPAITRVLIFRSRNGRSWSGPAAFPTHGLDEPDRPWLVVNPRRPANLDVVYAQGGSRVYMWRSMDHGAKFTGPVPVTGGHQAVTLSSRPLFDPSRAGRLFMLYETTGSAKIPLPHGQVYEVPLTQIWLATSTDAGRTWANRRILDSRNAIIGHSLVASAIDRRGDLYAAFSARRKGATRTTVYLIHSTTHGRTWSPPSALASPTASNVMPALAVTQRGTAYLSWYGSTSDDFRNRHAAWREMFASSPDPLARHPHFTVTQVSGRRPVHVGGITAAGALGGDTGANWGLRDFQGIALGPCKAPRLTWADDNGVKATQTAFPVPACSG